jgi:DNA (cytosine-5)-methyltransferase 1
LHGSRLCKGFTFVDLFSGIGGNRLAFERAGGECLFEAEPNEHARQVYFVNYGEMPVVDVEKISERDVPEHDLLSVSLPLVPFSLTGKNGRHSLIEWNTFQKVIEIIKVKRPKAILLQCSPRFTNNIEETLETELGYDIHGQVINSRFVVPQSLKRLYIVGFREQTPFQFPKFEGPQKLSDARARVKSLI